MKAVVTGLEMTDNGFEVSPHVGVVLRLPGRTMLSNIPPNRKIELEQLSIHFAGIKPATHDSFQESVDISESMGPSDEGGRVIDLSKLPPGTKFIRVWGTVEA